MTKAKTLLASLLGLWVAAAALLKPGAAAQPSRAGDKMAKVFIVAGQSNGWVALRVQPKHLSTPEEHFGPEIGLGHALAAARPEQRFAIIKNGRGASRGDGGRVGRS